MPKFNYVITDENGKKKNGSIDAPTKEAALQSIRSIR